jgi:hypothetical protein
MALRRFLGVQIVVLPYPPPHSLDSFSSLQLGIQEGGEDVRENMAGSKIHPSILVDFRGRNGYDWLSKGCPKNATCKLIGSLTLNKTGSLVSVIVPSSARQLVVCSYGLDWCCECVLVLC